MVLSLVLLVGFGTFGTSDFTYLVLCPSNWLHQERDLRSTALVQSLFLILVIGILRDVFNTVLIPSKYCVS